MTVKAPGHRRVALVRAMILLVGVWLGGFLSSPGSNSSGSILAAEPPARPTKREKVAVLTPAEFGSAVALAQVRSYIFNKEGQIAVLKGFDGREGWIEYVKMEDLQATLGGADVKLAETLFPLRIGIITASFPYKEQCAEFVRKLKLSSVAKLVGDEKLAPRFLGLNVNRCDVLPGGKTTPWQPLDLNKDFTPIVIQTGRRFQPEQCDLQPLVFEGLVMPRPLLFDGNQYPNVEMLPKIEKTLVALRDNGTGEQALKLAGRGSGGDTGDLFSSHGGQRTGKPVPGPDPAAAGTGKIKEDAVPEHILVRFLDVTVKPGKTYQYQLQIRMANPNYKENDKVAAKDMAEPRELTSPFVKVAGSLPVPSGFRYYAVDEKQLEKESRGLPKNQWKYLADPDITGVKHVTAMQIHYWLEQYPFEGRKNSYPVGEWTLADRVLVYRGEYLARKALVELPIWLTQRDDFFLALNPKNRREKRVEIFFGEGYGPEPGEKEPVIVDFEGGKVSYDRTIGKGPDEKAQTVRIQAKAPIEVLVLAGDGKLLVRDAAADAEDQERIDRRKAISKRLENLKNEKKKSETQPAGGGLFDPKKSGG